MAADDDSDVQEETKGNRSNAKRQCGVGHCHVRVKLIVNPVVVIVVVIVVIALVVETVVPVLSHQYFLEIHILTIDITIKVRFLQCFEGPEAAGCGLWAVLKTGVNACYNMEVCLFMKK